MGQLRIDTLMIVTSTCIPTVLQAVFLKMTLHMTTIMEKPTTIHMIMRARTKIMTKNDDNFACDTYDVSLYHRQLLSQTINLSRLYQHYYDRHYDKHDDADEDYRYDQYKHQYRDDEQDDAAAARGCDEHGGYYENTDDSDNDNDADDGEEF